MCQSVVSHRAGLRRGRRHRRGRRQVRRRPGHTRQVRCLARTCRQICELPDDGRAQIRGTEYLGRVAETDDPVDERALLGDDDPQAHDARRLPGLHRPGAECGDHAPGEPRVHDHRHFHRGGPATLCLVATWARWPASDLPGKETHGFTQIESRRQLEGC